MKSRVFTALILLLALSAARPPLWGQGVAQVADGVVVSTPRDQIHFAVCGPTSIHVTAAPQSARPSAPHQPWILQECSGGQFSLAQSDKAATITTAKLKVEIGLRDAGVIFRDADGKLLLAEGIWDRVSTRHYDPLPNNLYRVMDAFQLPDDEAIYGLGQHQGGMLNYRGLAVSLGQNNTDVAYLSSSPLGATDSSGTPPRRAP